MNHEPSYPARDPLTQPIEQFKRLWLTGQAPNIEEFLAEQEASLQPSLLRELLGVELALRRQAGEQLDAEAYGRRFPEQRQFIRQLCEETVDLVPQRSQAPTDRFDFQGTGDSPAGLTQEDTFLVSPTAGTASDFVARRFGDYQLLRELARGGMGVVYQARQVSLDRMVALKMILAGQLAGPDDVERFHTEAQAAANLDHPGIVPIYEIGEQEGQHFYSMGFVDGHSLAEELHQGPLAPRQAALYTQKVAEAIGFAHDSGVIHRDLKPANVLIDKTGEPRVTDFGLAKRTDTDRELTGTGQVMGTPAYMPPEQASGDVSAVTPLADVYALGAMLYCLLTGRPPFQAANPIDTILQVLHKPPVSLRKIDPSIPRDLETICARCLSKQPTQRYASAQALAADLRRWLQGEPIQARPVSRLEKSWLWCKRKPVVAGLIAGILLLALAGSGLFWERLQASRARGLLEALGTAEPGQVPSLIDDLQPLAWWARPRLQTQWADPKLSPAKRRRVGAALLVQQPKAVSTELLDLMFQTEAPEEFLLLRNELAPHMRGTAEPQWTELSTVTSTEERFRRLVALAAFDPGARQWPNYADELAGELIASNSLHLGLWSEALMPIREALTPPLAQTAREQATTEQGRIAATLLTRYAEDRPNLLIDLALDASPTQYDVLWKALPEADLLLPALEQELARAPQADASDEAKDALAARQANAAVTLFRLGQTDAIWPRLRAVPEPRLRTYLIDRLAKLGADADVLAAPLNHETEATVQQALLMALGNFEPATVEPAVRQSIIASATDLLGQTADPGVHSAAAWLLKRWNEPDKVTQTLASLPVAGPGNPRRWQIDDQGDTWAILDASTQFWRTVYMANPDGTPREFAAYDQLNSPLAVATHKVTLAQFRRFLQATPKFDDQMNYEVEFPEEGDEQQPATQVTWIQAARYCRWLSEQAGIPEDQMCFPRIEEIVEGMELPRDYLKRTGYRLPTQAEWECYCRGGTITKLPFGSDPLLLSQYSWHAQNSNRNFHDVGLLKPNDFGLFDVLGQCSEWCTDIIYFSPEVRERVYRGSTAWDDERHVEVSSPYTSANRETYRGNECGFRIVRTLPKSAP